MPYYFEISLDQFSKIHRSDICESYEEHRDAKDDKIFGLFEGYPGGDEMQADEPALPPPDTMEPLKRYFLIQKIHDLIKKLDQLNIEHQSLYTISTFIDSFSYSTLLIIMQKVLEDIQIQVAGLAQVAGSKKEAPADA